MLPAFFSHTYVQFLAGSMAASGGPVLGRPLSADVTVVNNTCFEGFGLSFTSGHGRLCVAPTGAVPSGFPVGWSGK